MYSQWQLSPELVWKFLDAFKASLPHYFSPQPDLGLEEAHVLHQALLEVTGVVYYILNDYTNLRQIRLKLKPTG